MPSATRWTASLLLSAALLAGGSAEDGGGEEDELSGPLMPAKAGGAPYDSRELAEMRGYPAEEHKVTTPDGYVLRVFRVLPKGAKRGVVLLQHGMMLSSDAWLTDNGSLPFLLSDAGYDVWLANTRGNAYSRAHATLRPDAGPFWAVGLDEAAAGDLPAVADKALAAGGAAALHLVGHSLGAALGLAMAARLPAARPKLRSLVALAPSVYLSKLVDMIGPDGMVHDLAAGYFRQLAALDKREAFPRADAAGGSAAGNQLTCADLADESARDMCADKSAEARDFIGGDYFPAGAPWRFLEQFYQAAFYGGLVRRYNHSTREENVKAYGAETPPDYAWADVTTPVALFSAANDQLVVPKDVDDLKAALKNVVVDVRIEEPECFDHMTFLTARHRSCVPARRKLYEDIVDFLKKMDAGA